MKITSFEKLQQFFSEDEKRKDSRVVRFINIETLDLWCKVKNLLASKCANCIQMSEFCSDEDLTPNMNRLLKSLREIRMDTLLVPLSEHLRINRNPNALSQIANLEFNNLYASNVRLYILIYRMGSELADLIKLDPRLATCVVSLETDAMEDNYSLIILPKKLSMQIKGNNIDGYKKYLAYWESNPNMPIILHTNNAVYYRDYAFADNVKVIDSAYEILRHLKIIDENVDKSWGEDWSWLQLLSKVDHGISLLDICSKYLSIKEFDAGALISNWDNQDDFGKWLIWLWLKLKATTPYMGQAIRNCRNFHSLISAISNEIFNINANIAEYADIYAERKYYLLALKIAVLPSSFWDKYLKIDINERWFRLTDCTEHEREDILRLIPALGEDRKKKDFLKISYSQLYNYLSVYIFDEQRITEYFSKYKEQKLNNRFTPEFVSEVKEIALLKGIWWKVGIKSRNEIINNYYAKNTRIIWVDALGAEYLGLIQALLAQNYPGCQSFITAGYSIIPTITDLNKDFVAERQFEYVKDLDNLVHNGEYPGCIAEEINVVCQQIRSAISSLDAFERVIITSDHGATRGSILAKGESVKAFGGASVERDGRYCIDKSNKYEIVHDACIDIDEYHVFADYDRFSIQGSAKNENHGGASLEEVIVPVVILSRAPLQDKVTIELLTPQPRMLMGKVKVKFRVNKVFDKISAAVGDKKYDCIKQDDAWCFEAECDQSSEYTAHISAKASVGSFKYKVNKGRSDNKNFDL